MMSKADYEIIIGVIKAAREHALGAGKNHPVTDFAIRLTSAMADALAKQNGRFSEYAFGVACLPQDRDYSGNFGFRDPIPGIHLTLDEKYDWLGK